MTRRTFIAASAAMAMNAGAQTRSKLGIATTCYMTAQRFRDTLEFLGHANSMALPVSNSAHFTGAGLPGQGRAP